MVKEVLNLESYGYHEALGITQLTIDNYNF